MFARCQFVALPPSGRKSTSAGLQKHVGVLELQLIKCYRLPELNIFDHNQQLVTFIALTALGKAVQSLDSKVHSCPDGWLPHLIWHAEQQPFTIQNSKTFTILLSLFFP